MSLFNIPTRKRTEKQELETLEDISQSLSIFVWMYARQHNFAPRHLRIRFSYQEVKKGKFMPVELVLSPTASVVGTPIETMADGTTFAFDPSKIKWDVQDDTVVSMTQNADGTVVYKALKVGISQVGVVDSATGLSATDTINVVAPPPPPPPPAPVSMSIKFDAPTP